MELLPMEEFCTSSNGAETSPSPSPSPSPSQTPAKRMDTTCNKTGDDKNTITLSQKSAFQENLTIHSSKSATATATIPLPQLKQEQCRGQRQKSPSSSPHILLGITGSVAAVKGPELAVALAQQLNAHVIVLLTRAGMNFWDRSAELYNPVIWKDLLALLVENSNGGGIQSFMSEDNRKMENNLTEDEEEVEESVNDIWVNDRGNVVSEQVVVKEENLGGKIILVKADDEWKGWTELGDPVLHIQLRDWADMLLIAPLSAHTLGKISNGLCDDTLTCVARAWDFGNVDFMAGTTTTTVTIPRQREPKPLVLAPAMNTSMWTHPLTQSQLNIIKGFWTGGEITSIKLRAHEECENNTMKTTMVVGSVDQGKAKEVGREEDTILACPVKIVDPQVKMLACGEIGSGAMANVLDIIAVTRLCLNHSTSKIKIL